MPTLPNKKKKEGDAYTVFGLSHDLNSRVHKEEVNGKKLSAVGVIVKTNLVACADDAKGEPLIVARVAVPSDGEPDVVRARRIEDLDVAALEGAVDMHRFLLSRSASKG